MKQSSSANVRIIGGMWRHRKVSFSSDFNIRPSPDRVRETLFNWLQGDIAGRRCLEPFAGSGILSFEALSRGAALVTLSETLTYCELNRRANRLARVLRDEYGVGADVCVGLCAEKSAAMLVGMLGILKAGGAYVPLDPEYPDQRVRAARQNDQSTPCTRPYPEFGSC